MRYVFDIDDTICKTINRDYENSLPIDAVISKMQDIKNKDPEAFITIHTARGMKSCGGNVQMAEQKNRRTMERWLDRNLVPYDEIIFGKPFADVYIDDKALPAEDFAKTGIEVYEGFSGAKVFRLGNTIIKKCRNAEEQVEWYKAAENLCTTPKIYSHSFGKIFMEYVKGEPMHELLQYMADLNCILNVMLTIDKFNKTKLDGENNPKDYAQYILERGKEVRLPVTDIVRKIQRNEQIKEKTFCHGDLSMSNIIINESRDVVIIDPSTKPFISTWLLDAAKFRASLNGLDSALLGIDPDTRNNRNLLYFLDMLYDGKYLDTIKLLEKSHYIRVAYYAQKLGKEKERMYINKLFNL